MKKNSKPTKVFPPGAFLDDSMRARNMTIPDFCNKTGFTASEVIDLFNGSRHLNLIDAEMIANVFGTSVEIWLTLEETWRESADA